MLRELQNKPVNRNAGSECKDERLNRRKKDHDENYNDVQDRRFLEPLVVIWGTAVFPVTVLVFWSV